MSYLLVNSGHNLPWLRNIPKGQLMRVRRNCTYDSDFLILSQVIEEKFIQKGYKQLYKIIQVKQDDYFEKQWWFISEFH